MGEQTEESKFWFKVFNELRNRRRQNMPIAMVDGLKGLTDSICAAFLRQAVQSCTVHLIRNF